MVDLNKETPDHRILRRLISEHDSELRGRFAPNGSIVHGLTELNAYYEGRQPLSYMHPELLRELEDRIQQLVINWPQLVVDSLEERLEIEGFRYPGIDQADAELQRVWQANNLDVWSSPAHVDAAVMRRSFTVVSHNDDDKMTPIVSVESPLQMFADVDPATRQVRHAVKRWKHTSDTSDKVTDMATLYRSDGHRITFAHDGRWTVTEDVDTRFGRAPVSVLPNRPRLLCALGESDLDIVTPLSDAACKIATDMMIGSEFHAIGQRWVFGVGPEEFKDPQTGQPISPWRAMLGRVWANKNKDAKAGQFQAADMKNFHNTIDQLAKLTASLAGIPIYEFGFVGVNPPSADSIRALEIRRIKRAERKQRALGGGWKNTQRLVRMAQTGEWDKAADRLEVIWRNPATPTIAQKTDAAMKRYESGITPLRQTREDLGYSETQIERMEDEDELEDPMRRMGRPAPDPDPEPAPASSGG